MLSQNVADNRLSMITIEKRFLVAYDILEIQRGKGTFVTENALKQPQDLAPLSDIKVNAKDLYEMRLIFEPEAAYIAAIRGTDAEIKRIFDYGNKIEDEILGHKDRTDNEIVPGHMNIDKIAEAVKQDVLQAGGIPFVFPAIAVCDGIAMGHEGMKFSLVTRELIADSTEAMATAHNIHQRRRNADWKIEWQENKLFQ